MPQLWICLAHTCKSVVCSPLGRHCAQQVHHAASAHSSSRYASLHPAMQRYTASAFACSPNMSHKVLSRKDAQPIVHVLVGVVCNETGSTGWRVLLCPVYTLQDTPLTKPNIVWHPPSGSQPLSTTYVLLIRISWPLMAFTCLSNFATHVLDTPNRTPFLATTG